MPAAPLTSSLQDPRVLAFLLVWFGVNLLLGLGSISNGWGRAGDSHIGGFLAGLLAFAAFDPIPISTGGGPNEGMDAPPPAINLDTIAGCALLAMPRRSRRRSACAANAVLVVIPARGAPIILCRLRRLVCFVSCCGALRGAQCRRATQSCGNRIPTNSCLCYVNAVPVAVMPNEALAKRSRVRRVLKGRNLAPNS